MHFSLPLAILLAPLALAAQTELKVFVIAGQSNAEGQAEVATRNATTGEYLNGTLAYQTLVNSTTAPLFAPLWDSARKNWTVLPDVKIWFNEANANQQGVNGSTIPSAPGDAAFGSLTVGYGCGADANLFGPELGFGFGMQAALPAGEQFLIMKVAWGGKSLAGDFRPPTSVATPDPFCQGECPNVVGHFYNVLVADVHKMLAPGAIATMFPDLAGLTPVLSGLGWFHGWNDGCSENDTAAYEMNFVNLVRDLRAEFGVPNLAVSTATAGFNGFDGAEATRNPPGLRVPPNNPSRRPLPPHPYPASLATPRPYPNRTAGPTFRRAPRCRQAAPRLPAPACVLTLC